MKKSIVMLLIGFLLAGGIAGLAAAAADTSQYDWCPRLAGNQAGPGQGAAGYGPGAGSGNFGACPYYDSGEFPELTVETEAQALKIAQDNFGDDITEDDIYQRGRCWVVYYTEDDTLKQGRIDAFTGEVTENFTPAGYQRGARFGGQRGQRGCGGRFA
ncbi:MAG: PepSY domain-containing protein [Methanosarcinaceae archaeon]|nr:PepSY domain-containing protein [Methanosarcinaceae archaeon]